MDSYYTFLKEGKNIIFSLDKEILDLINDKDAIDLIYKLLNFNPNQRYSAKEVLESNYLKEFENENSLDVEKISYPFDYEEISDDEMNYEKCVKIIKKNIKKFIWLSFIIKKESSTIFFRFDISFLLHISKERNN